ncbi:amidohydrolase [Pseudoroseomonas wenyumeiae]
MAASSSRPAARPCRMAAGGQGGRVRRHPAGDFTPAGPCHGIVTAGASRPHLRGACLMPSETDPRIAAIAAEATEWRRDIHAHPELAFQEHRTSDLVAAKLASWGIEVTRGIAGTGLVGTLHGRKAGSGNQRRAIGLRADMDALPMEEFTGLPYASKVPGRMHACGHDGHTSMLLGAAKYLAETKNFDGTVHFIFQPAEEDGGGGKVMVDEGLFTRFPCDLVFGIHNDSRTEAGTFTIARGSVCASADAIAIRVLGKGGHAARPQLALDPVLGAAHIIVAAQSVVSRRTDPLDSAVISFAPSMAAPRAT